jgi:hypothetical protein
MRNGFVKNDSRKREAMLSPMKIYAFQRWLSEAWRKALSASHRKMEKKAQKSIFNQTLV